MRRLNAIVQHLDEDALQEFDLRAGAVEVALHNERLVPDGVHPLLERGKRTGYSFRLQASAPGGHGLPTAEAEKAFEGFPKIAVKTGCQWREIPKDLPPWSLVRYYYDQWRSQGLIERMMHRLRGIVRRSAGRKTSPSAGSIDCQSVKTTMLAGPQRGFDNFKKVKGRKRHIVVDTMGLLLAVIVHAANDHESKTAFKLLKKLYKRFPRLKRIWADGAYEGDLVDQVRVHFGWILDVVKRLGKGFQVLPRRWVVERTFAWFEGYRRLSRDYERLPENSEAMVQLAMIRLMLNRIA